MRTKALLVLVVFILSNLNSILFKYFNLIKTLDLPIFYGGSSSMVEYKTVAAKAKFSEPLLKTSCEVGSIPTCRPLSNGGNENGTG